MKQNKLNFPVFEYDTVVIGTGAAGYATACRLAEEGKKSVCIVSEGVNCGTSRNTGSDKQTYYKLGLGGHDPDSVRAMAETLFSGGCTDGDNALVEAALSARCFYRLCELGVPFPSNEYGEFVGYKTDHDPFARATSAGPLTSKFMTEALERWANVLNVPIHDGYLAVEILQDVAGVCGLVCLHIATGAFAVFHCANIVLATGGPAGIYADSVYPEGHHGATGLALDAGASLQNMTEWQFGLASIAPRWNVSGSYMQVLPRFISVDSEGREYEFLTEFFSDPYEALSAVFLKGYQWPLHVAKVEHGSSVIDLLVYRESVLRGRRVYMDFRKNPFGLDEIDYDKLDKEAGDYLRAAKICFGTPYERLEKLNRPAIDLYLGHGVDLAREGLEIALCAQHCNGGVAVDVWWQSEIKGLFVAGECAGTHGITRPGGSALNAGQVGAFRASQCISAGGRTLSDTTEFTRLALAALQKHERFCQEALAGKNEAREEAGTALLRVRRRMSEHGAALRSPDRMGAVYEEIRQELATFDVHFCVRSAAGLAVLYRLRDALTVQMAMLGAMCDYADEIGASRGSALYYDANGVLRAGLDELFRFAWREDRGEGRVQQVRIADGQVRATWRAVRPIPCEDDCFETVWRNYRERMAKQNI